VANAFIVIILLLFFVKLNATTVVFNRATAGILFHIVGIGTAATVVFVTIAFVFITDKIFGHLSLLIDEKTASAREAVLNMVCQTGL
jgi:hypothetical protein